MSNIPARINSIRGMFWTSILQIANCRFPITKFCHQRDYLEITSYPTMHLLIQLSSKSMTLLVWCARISTRFLSVVNDWILYRTRPTISQCQPKASVVVPIEFANKCGGRVSPDVHSSISAELTVSRYENAHVSYRRNRHLAYCHYCTDR